MMSLLADKHQHDNYHQHDHSESDDHERQGDDSRRSERNHGSSNLRRGLDTDCFEQPNVIATNEAEDKGQLAESREQVVL